MLSGFEIFNFFVSDHLKKHSSSRVFAARWLKRAKCIQLSKRQKKNIMDA